MRLGQKITCTSFTSAVSIASDSTLNEALGYQSTWKLHSGRGQKVVCRDRAKERIGNLLKHPLDGFHEWLVAYSHSSCKLPLGEFKSDDDGRKNSCCC